MISTRCKGLRENVFLVYLEGALTSLLEKRMDLISPLEKWGGNWSSYKCKILLNFKEEV